MTLSESFVKKYLAPLYVEKQVNTMESKQLAKYILSKSNRVQKECFRVVEEKMNDNKMAEFTNALFSSRRKI